MANKSAQSITDHFAPLQDPRTGNATQHVLLEIVVIAICAAVCGADGWMEVQVWADANSEWLKTLF